MSLTSPLFHVYILDPRASCLKEGNLSSFFFDIRFKERYFGFLSADADFLVDTLYYSAFLFVRLDEMGGCAATP